VSYELAHSRDLPAEALGEPSGRLYRLRAQHRLHEPDNPVDRATDAELVALLHACRSARDRLIVLLMARAGLRRSEVAGLRRGDLHLLADNHASGARWKPLTRTSSGGTT
jgi:integrase/recombinase XerD